MIESELIWSLCLVHHSSACASCRCLDRPAPPGSTHVESLLIVAAAVVSARRPAASRRHCSIVGFVDVRRRPPRSSSVLYFIWYMYTIPGYYIATADVL